MGQPVASRPPSESGSQQKQSAGLWVRPWQERGKVGVMPELCCRAYCLVFWADTIRILPAVHMWSDHGPHRPCLTERASHVT